MNKSSIKNGNKQATPDVSEKSLGVKVALTNPCGKGGK